MNIQYVGFNVAATSRVYTFRVIEALEKIREFTVKVQLQAFRLTPLKFQDGPSLCFARLKRELDGETKILRARSCLCIGKEDIEEYLEGHYQPKRRPSQQKSRQTQGRKS